MISDMILWLPNSILYAIPVLAIALFSSRTIMTKASERSEETFSAYTERALTTSRVYHYRRLSFQIDRPLIQILWTW